MGHDCAPPSSCFLSAAESRAATISSRRGSNVLVDPRLAAAVGVLHYTDVTRVDVPVGVLSLDAFDLISGSDWTKSRRMR